MLLCHPIFTECGGVSYDSTIKACCDDVNVFDVQARYTCCKGTYQPEVDCTEERAIARKHKCGSKSYDISVSICCSSRIYSRTGGRSKCCMMLPYNPKSHYCHMTGLIRPMHTCTSSSKYMCCSGKKFKRRSGYTCCIKSYVPLGKCTKKPLCVGKPYYPHTRVCCGKVIHVKKSGYVCCSSRYVHSSKCTRFSLACNARQYNSAIYVCCSGKVYKKSSRKMCCAKSYYSYMTHQCRFGKVVNRRCMRSSRTKLCCRNVSYKKTKYSACCKTRKYSKKMSYCYRDVIRTKRSCGSVKYNPYKHVCCNKTLLHKRYLGYSCCVNNYYSLSESWCRFGKVYPK